MYGREWQVKREGRSIWMMSSSVEREGYIQRSKGSWSLRWVDGGSEDGLVVGGGPYFTS